MDPRKRAGEWDLYRKQEMQGNVFHKICHMCKANAHVEGGDRLESTGGKAEEQGEMTQHKEECGEDEDDNPKIISGRGNNEDSGEEFGNEGEVEVGKSKKDVSKAPLNKAKRRELD
eukprot:2830738-Ditylum_brightwellii.AAC.1